MNKTVIFFEVNLSIFSKLLDLYNRDPKPIFDHIRNIGIATVLVLGGRVALAKSDGLEENIHIISSFLSLSIIGIGALLFALNMNYGARSISRFLLGKHANIGVFERIKKIRRIIKVRKRIKSNVYKSVVIFYFKELATQNVIIIYYISVILVVASNSLSSGLIESSSQEKSEALVLNVPKISERIKEQDNIISELNTKIESLNEQIRSIPK